MAARQAPIPRASTRSASANKSAALRKAIAMAKSVVRTEDRGLSSELAGA